MNRDVTENRFVLLYHLHNSPLGSDVMTLICKNAPNRIKDDLLQQISSLKLLLLPIFMNTTCKSAAQQEVYLDRALRRAEMTQVRVFSRVWGHFLRLTELHVYY